MKIIVIFSDGTTIEREFTEAQEKAFFVEMSNPSEWIFNAVYQKARKVIDREVTKAGVASPYTEQTQKEQAFLDLNLPNKEEPVIN